MQIQSPTSSSSSTWRWNKTGFSPRRKRSTAASACKNCPHALLVVLWVGCFLGLVCIWSDSLFHKGGSLRSKQTHKQTQKQPPIASSFDWTDLPISLGVEGNCGADKCFWRSVSDPDTVGYLVASAKYHYERMSKAYDFAVEILDRTCGAKHLYLEPPKLVPIPEPGFAKKLNRLRKNRHYQFVDEIAPTPRNGVSRVDRKVYDASDPHLAIQKVRVAPDPSLAFGYMARKWDLLVVEDLPKFRELLSEKGTDLERFEAKLEDERRKIECAMDRSPTYWYDLQGLVDPDGNYHHMDVDSQFWVEVGDPGEPNFEAVAEGVKIVDRKETYDQRHQLIGKFNEMIQRLVHPPPEGVDELPAWDDDDEES